MITLAAYWLLATDAAGDAANGGVVGLVIPIVIIGAAFYFLLIRPQRKRLRDMESMRGEIGIGDEIRTVGGIFGVVKSMGDDEFVIDVGDGTLLRIAERAVAERLGDNET